MKSLKEIFNSKIHMPQSIKESGDNISITIDISDPDELAAGLKHYPTIKVTDKKSPIQGAPFEDTVLTGPREDLKKFMLDKSYGYGMNRSELVKSHPELFKD